jgi:hypothetical protein
MGWSASKVNRIENARTALRASEIKEAAGAVRRRGPLRRVSQASSKGRPAGSGGRHTRQLSGWCIPSSSGMEAEACPRQTSAVTDHVCLAEHSGQGAGPADWTGDGAPAGS